MQQFAAPYTAPHGQVAGNNAGATPGSHGQEVTTPSRIDQPHPTNSARPPRVVPPPTAGVAPPALAPAVVPALPSEALPAPPTGAVPLPMPGVAPTVARVFTTGTDQTDEAVLEAAAAAIAPELPPAASGGAAATQVLPPVDPAAASAAPAPAWTSSEDARLVEAVRLHGRLWDRVGCFVSRPPALCEQRYSQVGCLLLAGRGGLRRATDLTLPLCAAAGTRVAHPRRRFTDHSVCALGRRPNLPRRQSR